MVSIKQYRVNTLWLWDRLALLQVTCQSVVRTKTHRKKLTTQYDTHKYANVIIHLIGLYVTLKVFKSCPFMPYEEITAKFMSQVGGKDSFSRGVASTFWGTYCDDHTSHLSHLSTFSSYLTVIIGENCSCHSSASHFEPDLNPNFAKFHFFTVYWHGFVTIPKRPICPPLSNSTLWADKWLLGWRGVIT